MLTKNQGKNSSQLFLGLGKSLASKIVYVKNEQLYLKLIKKHLPAQENTKLVDMGGFKGEFISRIVKDLPQYHFDITTIDINKNALDHNHIAKRKICKNLSNTTLPNKYATLTILRYALSWNSLKEQEKILKEAQRITSQLIIISHQGPLSNNADKWRTQWDKLFSGKSIPKLKRKDCYFSSAKEIESIMKELNLHYKNVNQKTVNNIIDLFVEKYSLNPQETKKAKEIIKKENYIQITTWVINLKHT